MSAVRDPQPLTDSAQAGGRAGDRPAGVRNAMTVDVEDYYQVSAFEAHIPRAEWDAWPQRVERNTERFLALFDAAGVTATFFTLGWVAERYPALVRRIVAAGHELASHGFDHVKANTQSKAQFRADVLRTKALLEDTGGVSVIGYRAASFSIGPENLWALAELQDAGFTYSSSIYPIRHDHYGMPEAPRGPFRPDGAPGIVEIPVTTARYLNRNWPAGGGGYFRLYPYRLSRALIRAINQREGRAAVFYTHPWEIDPEQPRPAGLGAMTRFRHYVNQGRLAARLERLLQDFRWGPMREVFAEAIAPSAPRHE